MALMKNKHLHQIMGYTTKELLGCKCTNSLINLICLYDMLVGANGIKKYGMYKFYFHIVKSWTCLLNSLFH